MSLVAYGNANIPTAGAITNNGFWPDIQPREFRERHRIDTTITQGRVVAALEIAVASLNRQLSDYQLDRQAAGHRTADAVPPEVWQIDGHAGRLYRQGVFAEAHAQLLESYRDFTATREGDERGEAKSDAAEAYRRDARWAVSEIIGEPHTTVELI
ncbi:head completion/stabilization protein [Salinicola avicenniae]|uniref:head completion/stabilization protein n=1 Tax=Salinicola avicenniae TaxID=2916836 RepID=UPI002073A5D7|nr:MULTISPECIES: head completion/stabilization protein [unclassified Salinicola]